MYQWQHEYKDYDNNTRNETFYFNLSKAEILDMEWRTPGGIEKYYKRIIETRDGQKLADAFKELIQKSYGVKDPEGRRFIKNQEVLDAFVQTEAYSDLYILLATDDKAAAAFVNGVFPKDVVEAARKQKEMAEKAGISLVQTNTPEQPVSQPSVPMVEGQVVISPNQPTV